MSAIVIVAAVGLGALAGFAVAYWPSAALVLIAIAGLMILAKLGVDRMPETPAYSLFEPVRCRACKTAVPFDQCVCGSGFCLDCCACFYAEDLREAEGVL